MCVCETVVNHCSERWITPLELVLLNSCLLSPVSAVPPSLLSPVMSSSAVTREKPDERLCSSHLSRLLNPVSTFWRPSDGKTCVSSQELVSIFQPFQMRADAAQKDPADVCLLPSGTLLM